MSSTKMGYGSVRFTNTARHHIKIHTTNQMTRNMKKPSKITFIGFWVLLAMAILYFGANYLKGLAVFSRERHYFARFDNVSGVTVASPIMINGYKVGTVQGLDFQIDNNATTVVRLNIDKKLKIPKGTTATVRLSLFGGAQLDLTLGQSNEYLKEGEYIDAFEPDNDPMKILSNTILPSVVEMLPKIDSTFVALSKLSNNPHLEASIKEIHETLQHANQTMQTLNGLARRVDGYATQHVPSILQSVDSSAYRLNRFSQQLENIELTTLVQNLETTSQELKVLSQQLNSNKGSLGKLVNDDSLYNEVNALLQSVDSLVTDLKANPKKYLKISVF